MEDSVQTDQLQVQLSHQKIPNAKYDEFEFWLTFSQSWLVRAPWRNFMDITFAEVLSTFVEKNTSTCVWPGGEKHQRVCGQGQSLWKHGACLPIVVFFSLELSKYVLGIQYGNGKSIWALETCGISMAMLVYRGLQQRNCEFPSHLGRPNVASFNAVITACGLASKWQVWVCAGSWVWLSNCNKRWNVKSVSDSQIFADLHIYRGHL